MKEETSTEELNLSGVEQHKQEMQFAYASNCKQLLRHIVGGVHVTVMDEPEVAIAVTSPGGEGGAERDCVHHQGGGT